VQRNRDIHPGVNIAPVRQSDLYNQFKAPRQRHIIDMSAGFQGGDMKTWGGLPYPPKPGR